MKKKLGLMALLTGLGMILFGQNWGLVWSDEFDGAELDQEKWSYMLGTGTDYGLTDWGNNELQYYRAENAVVADGYLTITAKRESYGGKSYTSARIRTVNKGDWTYCRIECRAKLPKGKGLWPAIWMLPTDNAYGGWANSGEIDIMEYLGDDTTTVHGTIHYGGEWPNNKSATRKYTLDEGDFHNDFHDFAFEWEEGKMRWYVDGEHYGTITGWSSTGYSYPAPFNRRFHLLVNMAVGGNWPGNPDGTTVFPQELVLDYIRVYQEGINGSAARKLEEGEGQSLQVYPNPAGREASISYRVGEAGPVNIALYDPAGRRVSTLVDAEKAAGRHRVSIAGDELCAGTYLCRFQAGARIETCKLMVL